MTVKENSSSPLRAETAGAAQQEKADIPADIVERCMAAVADDRLSTGALYREAADEIVRLREALTEIMNHWACDYDHKHANTEMYRGSYGIGIVDGHRAAAIIARAALTKAGA
jgi:hypothetical protein